MARFVIPPVCLLFAAPILVALSVAIPAALAQSQVPANDPQGAFACHTIDFSSCQMVNGVNLPAHIQKFVSGTLTLDASVSSAVLNSGLSDNFFVVQ